MFAGPNVPLGQGVIYHGVVYIHLHCLCHTKEKKGFRWISGYRPSQVPRAMSLNESRMSVCDLSVILFGFAASRVLGRTIRGLKPVKRYTDLKLEGVTF